MVKAGASRRRARNLGRRISSWVQGHPRAVFTVVVGLVGLASLAGGLLAGTWESVCRDCPSIAQIYVTEVAESSHSRGPKPALMFGGTKLGMKHGTFVNAERPQCDLFVTAAQAYLKTNDPMSKLGSEKFASSNRGAAPIPGLWEEPTPV